MASWFPGDFLPILSGPEFQVKKNETNLRRFTMMKRILILMLVFVFGLSGASFAGVVELTDDAMDGINAGDWVILEKGGEEGGQKVEDVYTNNNTLWLLENSQKDIQAVSNANVIDSAVAVQSNIARVSGDATENVAVNQSNTADLTNYRPADSTSNASRTSTLAANQSTSSSAEFSSHSGVMAINEASQSSSGSAAASGSALAHNETLDVAAAIAGSSKDIGKYGVAGGTIAGALVVDYDKVITSSSSASSSSSSAANASKQMTAQKAYESGSASETQSSAIQASETETLSTSRNAKGANNHILLDSASQQSLKAVSNLNSVASGAAVQNNIASNVGVSGTITHVNSATVSSGF